VRSAHSVTIRWRRRPVSARFLRRAVAAALRAERRALRLSVVLVGDREIRGINRRFLDHDYATDVIAFPLGKAAAPGDVEGEIFVSGDHALRQAGGRGHSWRAELALYLVHGALHLCGHDDHGRGPRARMIRRERTVLAGLGYEVRDRR
jgi:probable rRNA maturation factor